MTFSKLLLEVQQVKPEEKRQQTTEYLEIVISKDVLESLHRILTAYLGAPLKPEGHSPSREASRRAKSYGGIRRDQTMYFRRNGKHEECALLWPWGNGTHITVKIIQSQSSGSDTGLLEFLAGLFCHK